MITRVVKTAMMCRRVWRVALPGFLLLAVTVPIPAWSDAGFVGTARGIRAVELSIDGSNTWLPLGRQSLPIMGGTQIRSTTGGAVLDLTDGSRLNVLPFSAVRFQEIGLITQVTVLHGRLTFRLPERTRAEIRTAWARLEPVRQDVMVGEVFVGGDGTTGLRMTQGSFRVHELVGEQRTMVASLEPMFLPKKPLAPGPLFSSARPAAPPAGVKGIFTPKGESVGYLRPDGQLVVYPGFTADLTQPFSPKLVQLAMAKISEKDRPEALPLFDVNGRYMGYLAGPVFYAQAQVAQAVEGTAPGTSGGTLTEPLVGLAAVTVPVVIGALADGGGGGAVAVVATPLQPRR